MYTHVTAIKERERRAVGHQGPPSHNPTKLYNFANIPAWPSDYRHSLFQAKTRRVRNKAIDIHAMTPWESAELRCLHMRFMTRSSLEDEKTLGKRLTPEDNLGYGSYTDRGKRDDANERTIYRIGEPVEVDASMFPMWRDYA
jgi:hypothetical protein